MCDLTLQMNYRKIIALFIIFAFGSALQLSAQTKEKEEHVCTETCNHKKEKLKSSTADSTSPETLKKNTAASKKHVCSPDCKHNHTSDAHKNDAKHVCSDECKKDGCSEKKKTKNQSEKKDKPSKP